MLKEDVGKSTVAEELLAPEPDEGSRTKAGKKNARAPRHSMPDGSDEATKDLESLILALNESQAIVEFDLRGTILKANQNFLHLLGYTLEEVKGKHHSIFLEEEHRGQPAYLEFWRKLENGEQQTGEFERRTKSGKEVWIQGSYMVSRDNQGRPAKIVKVATDVTSIVKSRREAELMRGAINKVSTAIMMVDRDFVVSYVNETTRQLLADNESIFQTVWPTFTAKGILGTCIDLFHKHPEQQRKMLSDPKNLPHRTDISVGPLTFSWYVNASFNAAGKYVGNVLEWTDVTELRKKEATNLDYLEQMIGVNRSLAVIQFGMDGTILSANENLLKVMGYRADEIVGQHHKMFLSPGDQDSADYKNFWAGLRRGEHQTGEFKRVRKDGHQVWLQASYTPILNDQGNAVKVVKFATDLTADVENKKRAVLLQGAINNATTAIMMVNRDFVVTYVNETTRELLRNHAGVFRTVWPGFDPEAIVGSCIDLFHKNPAHQRRMLSNPENLPHRTDISVGPLRFSLCVGASLDPNGKYIGNVLEWADVTELRKKEATNRDLEGQMVGVNHSLAVIQFKPDGTILTANENFLRTVGYQAEEIVGKHHRLFVREDERDSAEYAEFWARLGRGEHISGQFRRLAKDGSDVYLQASYTPILDAQGNPVKIAKFAVDLTPQKVAAVELDKKVASTLKVVQAAAAGDLTEVLSIHGEDAIGRVAECLRDLFGNLRSSLGKISSNAHSVGTAAEELTGISEHMAHNAENTSRQSMAASAASEEVSRNVEMVASSTEEMLASIREISKSANDAARVAGAAVDLAATANRTVARLGESSQEIGKVVKVITSIAQQTNLLALNATIEAARAGEAGKGFAVVANEVKDLAKATAAATEEIGRKIVTIQGDAAAAVAGIGEISGIIREINDVSASLASAVEQQTATTNEIGRNVSDAARGTGEITRNIAGVAAAAQQTTHGAIETQKAAAALKEMAVLLEKLMKQFKVC